MKRLLFLFGISSFLCDPNSIRAGETGPWILDALKDAPAFRWVDEESPIRELLYAGELYRGKPTEVFAFYATPETAGVENAKGPFPAVVLIHGGGGTAFAEWVWLWAKRGYAAIAMDLSGRRPPSPVFDENGELKEDRGRDRQSRTRLEKGGPEQGHEEKFGSIGGDTDDDWPYHAVASVIRAHSLVRSFSEVDPERTAVTGISWGGYTTCLVASIDHRFAAAVPVYGCGYLFEGESVQKKPIDALGDRKAEWIRLYDPSSHLGKCRVPIFFVNGTHDIHYPLDSYQKSFDLVPGPKQMRIEPRMSHSHPAGWAPEEIGWFIDSHCRGGVPLPKIEGLNPIPGGTRVEFDFSLGKSGEGKSFYLTKVELHYTEDSGLRSKREWKTSEINIRKRNMTLIRVPPKANTWILTITDQRGAMVSSEVQFRPN